ncbi:MAG TPA: hypothetical protein VFG05_08925 [Methylocella sp.]|nr:hypothetical protein [Methylocella sp.]
MKGYLHIGMPKTATTSIQNTLYSHRDHLLAKGRILYPALDANLTTPLCSMFLENPQKHVTNRLISKEDLPGIISGYFAALESDLKRSGFDTIVFSAEGLANLRAPEISRLKDWLYGFCHDWTILFWARHPVGWTTSNIQQILKSGLPLESIPVCHNLPNYKGRLTHWIKLFGKETIQLSNFDEIITQPGGAVAHFARQIGLDAHITDLLVREQQHENMSMSHECAELLSALNRLRPMIVDNKLGLQRTGRELELFMQIPGRKFELSPAARAEIRELSRSDVAWLNETFGVSYYPDLFDEPYAPGPESETGSQRWQQNSIEALALIFSNLINSNFALQRAHAAEAAVREKRFTDAVKLYSEAARVNPHNATYRKRAEALRRNHGLVDIN